MTRVRQGFPAELPTVLDLLDKAVVWLVGQGRTGQWGESPPAENPQLVSRMSDYVSSGSFFIATHGEDSVGAMVLGDAPEHIRAATEPELYIKFLIADRTRPGLGAGRTLVDFAKARAIDAGVVRLRVDCYRSADRSLIKFYERCGFVTTEEFIVSRPIGDWPGQLLELNLVNELDMDDPGC